MQLRDTFAIQSFSPWIYGLNCDCIPRSLSFSLLRLETARFRFGAWSTTTIDRLRRLLHLQFTLCVFRNELECYGLAYQRFASGTRLKWSENAKIYLPDREDAKTATWKLHEATALLQSTIGGRSAGAKHAGKARQSTAIIIFTLRPSILGHKPNTYLQ